MGVRLDKWLQVARVFKTRSQATRACALGRVRVNALKAKAHKSLELDDEVQVDFTDGWTRVLCVLALRDRPVSKAEAAELYEDKSAPRPRRDAIDRLMLRGPAGRERGQGRPTKRERRQIDQLRRSGRPGLDDA